MTQYNISTTTTYVCLQPPKNCVVSFSFPSTYEREINNSKKQSVCTPQAIERDRKSLFPVFFFHLSHNNS